MPTKVIRRVHVSSAVIVFAVFGLAGGILGGLLVVSGSDYRGLEFYLIFVLFTTIGGALSGALQAFLYNIAARHVGGLRIDLNDDASQSATDVTNEAVLPCPNCHALEERARDTCRFCGESLHPD